MKILVINAGCQLGGHGGTLNQSFTELAQKVLTDMGHSVAVTHIKDGWNKEEEIQKLLDADRILLQTPGWWMGLPWQMKKYFDEVLTGSPLIPNGDGRHRDKPECRYGSGGVFTQKKVMVSSTWNAPEEAFSDPSQFFEGRGPDGVFFPVRKVFEFMGYEMLPYFMSNDVFKNPTIEEDFVRFEAHLRRFFA